MIRLRLTEIRPLNCARRRYVAALVGLSGSDGGVDGDRWRAGGRHFYSLLGTHTATRRTRGNALSLSIAGFVLLLGVTFRRRRLQRGLKGQWSTISSRRRDALSRDVGEELYPVATRPRR